MVSCAKSNENHEVRALMYLKCISRNRAQEGTTDNVERFMGRIIEIMFAEASLIINDFLEILLISIFSGYQGKK